MAGKGPLLIGLGALAAIGLIAASSKPKQQDWKSGELTLDTGIDIGIADRVAQMLDHENNPDAIHLYAQDICLPRYPIAAGLLEGKARAIRANNGQPVVSTILPMQR